jgi:hypothetical protein
VPSGAVRGVTACLLHYDPASYSSRARLSISKMRSRSESESEEGGGAQAPMKSVAVDPKPKRSTHVQDESRVTPGGGPNP